MDVERDGGLLSHWYRWIAGHTGEIAAAVSVDWSYVQVAPGCHSLPVWKHFLLDEGRRKEKCQKWMERLEFKEGR